MYKVIVLGMLIFAFACMPVVAEGETPTPTATWTPTPTLTPLATLVASARRQTLELERWPVGPMHSVGTAVSAFFPSNLTPEAVEIEFAIGDMFPTAEPSDGYWEFVPAATLGCHETYGGWRVVPEGTNVPMTPEPDLPYAVAVSVPGGYDPSGTFSLLFNCWYHGYSTWFVGALWDDGVVTWSPQTVSGLNECQFFEAWHNMGDRPGKRVTAVFEMPSGQLDTSVYVPYEFSGQGKTGAAGTGDYFTSGRCTPVAVGGSGDGGSVIPNVWDDIEISYMVPENLAAFFRTLSRLIGYGIFLRWVIGRVRAITAGGA